MVVPVSRSRTLTTSQDPALPTAQAWRADRHGLLHRWGMASVTNVMTDGRMVEVATIGNEGMVGMTVFLGGTISPGEAFIQVSDGDSQAMPADAFRKG